MAKAVQVSAVRNMHAAMVWSDIFLSPIVEMLAGSTSVSVGVVGDTVHYFDLSDASGYAAWLTRNFAAFSSASCCDTAPWSPIRCQRE